MKRLEDDYYDFIELNQSESRRLGIAVGNVSGHGTGSALLMTTVRGILKSTAGPYGSRLNELFELLNQQLLNGSREDFFMTLFYGVLDETAKEFYWISAGHGPALWLKADKTVEKLPCSGIPLGIMVPTNFDISEPCCLQSGEIFLIDTHGIWESTNASGEFFGVTRLTNVLKELSNQSAEQIYSAIMDYLSTFQGESVQHDDITMVVLKTL